MCLGGKLTAVKLFSRITHVQQRKCDKQRQQRHTVCFACLLSALIAHLPMPVLCVLPYSWKMTAEQGLVATPRCLYCSKACQALVAAHAKMLGDPMLVSWFNPMASPYSLCKVIVICSGA